MTRWCFIAYLLLLTGLLLTERPENLLGMRSGLPSWLALLRPYAHLMSFFVLSVLAWASQWHVPRWGLAVLFAAYGGATEVLQGLVPHRHPDAADWCQDLAGIAVGFVVCGCLAATYVRLPARREQRVRPAEGVYGQDRVP